MPVFRFILAASLLALLSACGDSAEELAEPAPGAVSTGPVGVMQLLPSTGDEMGVGDVTELDNNIHAVAKSLRFMIDRYYDEPGIAEENRVLLALASYNAGPRRVRELRAEARTGGLDPDRWFDHVKVIAARRIGRETVDYVRNIYKYYVACKLVLARNRQVEQRGGL